MYCVVKPRICPFCGKKLKKDWLGRCKYCKRSLAGIRF
jgi:predicted amidophosphoribosyltransferase